MAEPGYTGYLYAASRDAMAIETMLGNLADCTEAIAFHSHQVAEKNLKATLHMGGYVPPRTHALDELLGLAQQHGLLKPTPEEIAAATDLTEYAVAARYKTAPDILEGEALEAIALSNMIADMIERCGHGAVFIRSEATLLRKAKKSIAP